MPGFEPRSGVSQTPVISTTFTCPCSRLKPVRVPGVEPGSRGSKPPMLSVTPHPQEADVIEKKTPPGLEPREGYNAGLQGFECTLIGTNSSAMTIPPTELIHVHLTHLFLAAKPHKLTTFIKLTLFCSFFSVRACKLIVGANNHFTRRVILAASIRFC